MRQEHRLGIPVPDLLGSYVDIAALVRIDVDKKLRRVKYLIDRFR